MAMTAAALASAAVAVQGESLQVRGGLRLSGGKPLQDDVPMHASMSLQF